MYDPLIAVPRVHKCIGARIADARGSSRSSSITVGGILGGKKKRMKAAQQEKHVIKVHIKERMAHKV
jgi:hypothetical protein